MPRASPRRLFLSFLCLISGILLVINVFSTFQTLDNNDKEASLDRENITVESNNTANNDPIKGESDKTASETPLKTISSSRPWYLSGGAIHPEHVVVNSSGDRNIKLFPEESSGKDRITDQLMFLPPAGDIPDNQEDVSLPLKKILMWNGVSSWGGVRPGRGEFIKQECPVSMCAIVTDRGQAEQADMVLFNHYSRPQHVRPWSQIWMIYMLECPLHTQVFSDISVFNWTATYRSDSTIVTPYERWHYYDQNIKTLPQKKDFAANKTGHVAWFVSNCGARNGRLQYAQELAQYIGVDIYGACGSLRCPRTSAGTCFDMLDTKYKFYLAFENSNCQDYITEKFFVNGLGHNVLPIVMGARPADYQKAAPYKSFIHVDQFKGPRELAEYLIELDRDDQKYNEYFQWKGTGEFINTRFFCRVCALLHDKQSRSPDVSSYSDINDWWRGDGVCSNAGWRLEGEMKEERRKEEKMKEEGRKKEKRREDRKNVTQRKVKVVNKKVMDRNASTSDNSSLPVV